MTDRKPWEVFDDKVLPRLTVETVFSDVEKLKRSGRGYMGLCPLHGEKNPSFSVFDPDRLLWKCHGCGEKGDAVRYVMQRRGLTWIDAARELARLAGVDETELETWRTRWTAEDWKRHEERERRGSLLSLFFELAHEALLADAAAVDYLKKRGFESFENFGLFTTQAEMREFLRGEGFTPEEVEASGLFVDSRWEGRLVIPWRDHGGHLASLIARDITGKADPGSKYLNLKGTKKDELVAFGLDVALRSGGKKNLVLVEGPMDTLLLQARGLGNVAATGGTGTSPAMFEALARLGAQAVTLVFDNDEPGRKATEEAARHAGNVNVNVYVLDAGELGDSKDPDEFVRKNGTAAFWELLKGTVSGPVYLGAVRLEGVTPESPAADRHAAVERLLDLEAGLRGPRLALDREDLRRMAADSTGYSFKVLAGMAERRAALRREGDKEKTFQAALSGALAAMTEGKDFERTKRELFKTLAVLETAHEAPPPPFSVDALWEEMRRAPAGRTSGWGALDDLGVRFNAGELAVFGARTGHAKTSVLVGLLFHWVKTAKPDEVFVYYSFEEPVVPLARRLLSLLTLDDGAGWTSEQIRDYLRDPCSRDEWPDHPKKLEAARERLSKLEDHLLVVYRPTWTVDKLAAHARAVAEECRVGAVFADYLQHIPPDVESPGRRDVEVSRVSRVLKELSVSLSAPVVTGAQVNREAVPRDYTSQLLGKTYKEATSIIRLARPDLQHLREGGSEQEADLVLGLLNYVADYRTEAKPSEEHTPPDATLLEVGVLKNRDGEMGRWAGLAFDRSFRRVRDAEVFEEDALQVEAREWRGRRRTAEDLETRLQIEQEKTKREELRTERKKASPGRGPKKGEPSS